VGVLMSEFGKIIRLTNMVVGFRLGSDNHGILVELQRMERNS